MQPEKVNSVVVVEIVGRRRECPVLTSVDLLGASVSALSEVNLQLKVIIVRSILLKPTKSIATLDLLQSQYDGYIPVLSSS